MLVKPRALDLFCCAGGATKGLQRAGFRVTGIDIKPQPRYCGDAFIQGDAIAPPPPVDLGAFDFIWASPPCQAHTTLKVMWNAKEHADLIPATRELLIASGLPWCMENVPGSTLERGGFYLCGSMFGLGVQAYDGWRQLRRHRWFEATFRPLIPSCQHRGATIGDHARDRRRKPGARDRGVDFPDSDKLSLGRAAMEMPWSDWHGISQAIPPAYSEFIGRQAMQYLVRKN